MTKLNLKLSLSVMSANLSIEYIKNKSGNRAYAMAHLKSVVDSNGKYLDELLNGKQPCATNGVDCPNDGSGNYSPVDNVNYNNLGTIAKLFLAVPINFPNGTTLRFTAAADGCSLGWQSGTKWSSEDPSGDIEGGASYILVMLNNLCTLIREYTPSVPTTTAE